MRSVLGYNEKPNCLVIDEIDGAPAVSDELLPATCKKEWVTCTATNMLEKRCYDITKTKFVKFME